MFVVRHPHPRDGRARIVRSTPRGEELWRTCFATSRGLEAEWVARIGPDRVTALRATLEDMVGPAAPGD